jgi:hypothetical protein
VGFNLPPHNLARAYVAQTNQPLKKETQMELTVNELMVLMKKVRERHSALQSIASSVATKETYYSDRSPVKSIEPQYDLKAMDKRVVELDNFLYLAEAAIKQSNAVTKIKVPGDYSVEGLLRPLE